MFTQNTGLHSFSSFPLSKECIVSIGGGKFVIICRDSGNLDEIGYVVVSVDSEGALTLGTPGEFPNSSGVNPIAYYDKSQSKLVVIYGAFPGNEYYVCSIAGLSLSVVSSGSISGVIEDFPRAVSYSDYHNKAVLCVESNHTVPSQVHEIAFYALTLAGSVLTGLKAPTIISSETTYGNSLYENLQMEFCGQYGLIGFTNELLSPASEVRVLESISGAFDISAGLAVPLTAHKVCLGLAGSDDGTFSGYWADGSSNVPYILAGQIDGPGNVSFGATQLQYAAVGWGGTYGDYTGVAAGAGAGLGVFMNRITGDKVSMFSVQTDNLVPTVVDAEVTAPDFSLDIDIYDFVGIAIDKESGYCLGCFFDTSGDIYVSRLFVEIAVPLSIFWKNSTLQKEIPSDGRIIKQETSKVIPGKVGQAYRPATAETSPAVSVSSGVNQVCKRVI